MSHPLKSKKIWFSDVHQLSRTTFFTASRKIVKMRRFLGKSKEIRIIRNLRLLRRLTESDSLILLTSTSFDLGLKSVFGSLSSSVFSSLFFCSLYKFIDLTELCGLEKKNCSQDL